MKNVNRSFWGNFIPKMNVDENGHLTIISGAGTGSLPFTSVSNDFNIDENKTL